MKQCASADVGGKAQNWDDISILIISLWSGIMKNNAKNKQNWNIQCQCSVRYVYASSTCNETVYLPVTKFVWQNDEKQGWLGFY